MKQIFLEAYEEYLTHMRTMIPDYDESLGHGSRRRQCQAVIDSINEDFNFNELVILESGSSSNYHDGLFGLYLGYLLNRVNGKMMSVDTSIDATQRSKEIFKNVLPDISYTVFVDDSLSFINDIQEIPNIVHLDSWDFNLFDPLPSALHGWEEFKAIESKMVKGSIIIIDDNYKKDTYLEWYHANGVKDGDVIRYPMLGKGAHVYQHVLNNETDWKLIGEHYGNYDNLKIILQKK